MGEFLGYDINKAWDYENGYYLTSPISRIAKLCAHYDLYKRIVGLPGHIVELGVLKGASLIRLATFRNILESELSRKVIGFDVFGKFPKQEDAHDKKFAEWFEGIAGEGIGKEELESVFQSKGISNIEFVSGDILETVPEYVGSHPELKIAFLHIDVDVYRPTQIALEFLYDRVVRGGVIVFDDYGTVSGETKAVDEFMQQKDVTIQKLSISHIPSFIVKN